LPRLALATVQLERRFSSEPATLQAVANGLAGIAPRAQELGSTHPEVLAALGSLYADTISHLRPRIMVQGNPHYRGQPGVVSEIRARRLAAVRSAMLWRELGGAQWHLLFARRGMAEAVRLHRNWAAVRTRACAVKGKGRAADTANEVPQRSPMDSRLF